MEWNDLIPTATLGFLGWVSYTLHRLDGSLRVVAAKLEEGSKIHDRHERLLENHEERLNGHSEQLARLKP